MIVCSSSADLLTFWCTLLGWACREGHLLVEQLEMLGGMGLPSSLPPQPPVSIQSPRHSEYASVQRPHTQPWRRFLLPEEWRDSQHPSDRVRSCLLAAFLAYQSCHSLSLRKEKKTNLNPKYLGTEKGPDFATRSLVSRGSSSCLLSPSGTVPGWLLWGL